MSEKPAATGKSPGKNGAGAAQGQKSPAGKSGGQSDARLLEDIKMAQNLPLPGKDAFWQIDEGRAQRGRKSLLGIFKKKDLTEEELSTLRQEAETAPGRARVKIQMLSKKYAKNNALTMLSALCTYRLVLSTSNRKNKLEGMRMATKDAASVLINDGISLYNCENFFHIYFDYLSKIKRLQLATFKTLREGTSHRDSRNDLTAALKTCEGLLDEKARVGKVLNQVKGKFKSSSYTVPWGFLDIQAAGKKMEENDFKAICGPAEARQTLVYTLALADLFARIPILYPLVDSIMQMVPESTDALLLRKSSVLLTRSFTQLNIAIHEGNESRKQAMGRQIFADCNKNLNRISNQPIRQSFEADPYFYLSRVAILTFGSYEAQEQKDMLQNSLKAMQQVAKLDVTKAHIYTESAQDLVRKITNLMAE